MLYTHSTIVSICVYSFLLFCFQRKTLIKSDIPKKKSASEEAKKKAKQKFRVLRCSVQQRNTHETKKNKKKIGVQLLKYQWMYNVFKKNQRYPWFIISTIKYKATKKKKRQRI